MSDYHIAQINVGRTVAPTDDPAMRDFMDNLAPINALADATPGFVWRLQTDEGNATALRFRNDPGLFLNMSVWESIDALHQFTYYSAHTEFFRRRAEWFHRLDTPVTVLWWIPAGHIPTMDEADQRLALLETHGPTPLAFTFKQRFTVEEMLAFNYTSIEEQ
jgi:hypothetical protein